MALILLVQGGFFKACATEAIEDPSFQKVPLPTLALQEVFKKEELLKKYGVPIETDPMEQYQMGLSSLKDGAFEFAAYWLSQAAGRGHLAAKEELSKPRPGLTVQNPRLLFSSTSKVNSGKRVLRPGRLIRIKRTASEPRE